MDPVDPGFGSGSLIRTEIFTAIVEIIICREFPKSKLIFCEKLVQVITVASYKMIDQP